jgi:hypothetical protein
MKKLPIIGLLAGIVALFAMKRKKEGANEESPNSAGGEPTAAGESSETTSA